MTIPGGLGAHKWADRRLLARMAGGGGERAGGKRPAEAGVRAGGERPAAPAPRRMSSC